MQVRIEAAGAGEPSGDSEAEGDGEVAGGLVGGVRNRSMLHVRQAMVAIKVGFRLLRVDAFERHLEYRLLAVRFRAQSKH